MTRYKIDYEHELAGLEWRFWFVTIVGSALAAGSIGSAVASLMIAL